MERNILDLLEKGPVVADGKLECAIVEKLRLPKRPATYKTVIGKLERLEEKGKTVIERNGSVLRGVRLAPNVRLILPNFHTEDGETADEPLQAETFTQANVESNDVKIESEKPITMNETPTMGRDPIWVRLSLALLALQTAASPDGRLTGSSAQIIARELVITLNQANALNGKLAELGLRQTTGAKANTVHQINMTKKEITEEDLRTVKAVGSKPKIEEATSVENDATSTATTVAEDEASSTDTVSVPISGSRPIIEQMADVLEILDKENRGLKDDIRTLERRIENQRQELIQKDRRFDEEGAKTARVVAGLTDSLTAANTKIADLQEQVRTLTAPPSERVNELLARHLGSASDTPS